MIRLNIQVGFFLYPLQGLVIDVVGSTTVDASFVPVAWNVSQ